jgi:hypothetical protein
MPVFHLSFVAPVPVGHRVAVTFYELKVGRLSALLGGQTKGFVVEDLETGIEYSPAFLWQSEHVDHQPIYSSRLDKNVHPTGAIEGLVTQCRVVSRRGNANNHRISTILTVTTEAEQ